MKRTPTTIYLQSPNAITPLPWVNNAPDFSEIEEPTLSILINSWNTFLESGEELEIIPDPEPISEPIKPQWGYFGGALIQSSLYDKYKINPDFQVIGNMISTFSGSGDNPSAYPIFSLVWSKFIESSGGLLELEIKELNSLCAYFNIPFTIDTNSNLIF